MAEISNGSKPWSGGGLSLAALKARCRAKLRLWGLLTATLERRQARRVCVEVLRLYHQVERELPQLTGSARYAEVVARRIESDLKVAQAVLERAAASFAEWPLARHLTFRDVVHYLAALECLNDNPQAVGLRIQLPHIVAAHIPQHL
jgi:hypothetical protein